MINGKWHAEGSAAQCGATLHTNDGQVFYIKTEDGATYTEQLESLKISDRLGNVERKITLLDGSLFVTNNNDAIDEMFKQTSSVNGLIHRIESHMGWVAIALVVTALSTFSFFKWGVPWASQKIAHALPQETNNLIAGHTFKFLDKYLFEESELDLERRAQIRKHFNETLVPYGDDGKIKYTLHFRDWSGVPNALALPSGDIILTDKFVELSESQDEIDAVLLHEMGHVVHRHSLEMVIEGTFVTVAIMMVIGDTSGLADMGVGLGSLLISSNYSRGHESEADLYAFEKMLLAKIDPVAFSTIMARITSHMEGTEDSIFDEKSDEDAIQDNKKKEKADPLDYLSSHPSTKKRIEIARQYSECFKKGLTSCNVVLPE